jgi:tetratricopeptide (TPR) repeat protein
MRLSRVLGLFAGCALLASCATRMADSATGSTAGPAPAPPPPTLAADTSPFGLFLAGRTARDEGHLGAAADFLSRAAEADGEVAYLRADAFHAALEAGDVAGATTLIPAGADASPADVRLGALVRGVELFAEGDDKKAYAIFASPDQAFPFREAALLLAPYAAAGAGDAAHAVQRPALGGQPLAQFSGDLDQADVSERLGRLREAEAEYQSLLRQSDPGGVTTLAYGAFLERRGRAAEAKALYQAAFARNPDDADLAAASARVQNRGRAPALGSLRQGASRALILPAAGLIAQKQQGLALIDLRLALRLDPNDDEAWLLVGDLLSPGDIEAGRAAYQHIGAGSEQYVPARDKLAASYQEAGDHDRALAVAKQTVLDDPQSRDAQVTLANLLRDDAEYADSAAVLTKLIDRPGAKPDWRLYFLRASAYDEIGDAKKTEADLQVALKLEPDQPELLNFQGYFWIDRGERLEEALAMVQRAVSAEPESGAMVDSLGWAYYRLGDFKSAVERLQDAVTLDPSIPEVNDHLGDAYWRIGRKTEAVFQWRRALSLGPDAKLKSRVEQKLASPLGPDAPAGPPPAETKTP